MGRLHSALVWSFALHILGCNADEPAAADVCEKAMNVFTRCGVTLPILSGSACTGVTRAIGRCIANHATNCEELASLQGRLDACVQDELDAGETFLPPAEDLPLPSFEGGNHDAGDRHAPFSPPDGGGVRRADDGGVSDAERGSSDSNNNTDSLDGSSG